MKIAFSKPSLPSAGALVLAVAEGGALSPTAQTLDAETKGSLTRAMTAARFEGKANQTLTLLAPAGLDLARVLLIGIGKAKAFNALSAQALGGTAIATLLNAGDTEATLAIEPVPGVALSPAQIAAEAGFGARRRAYRFDKYRTKEKKEDKPSLKRLNVTVEALAEAKAAFSRLDSLAEAISLTRDLVTEPGNVIIPQTLAEKAKSLTEFGVEVEILDEKAMRKLGMGSLLGVGQGSEHESRLVVMQWRGAADPKTAPIAFIGKGVTFDSGGISIKPAAGMEEMKGDMAGAATVIGAIRALAARKAAVNVIGVIGLVENMPSGSAQRPGDVVTSMSGQTIEVINTDAEGRLVLADALWYTQDRFKPKIMVDLATLTGAILIALGHEYAGLFASDDRLAERLTAAGTAVGEPLWRLPLGEAYDKQLKSDIADMKNVGGREGGSITAAQFLKRFTNDVAWAHIDIAGTSWSKKDSPTCPKGATGFGVALLDRLVADHYEDKGSK